MANIKKFTSKPLTITLPPDTLNNIDKVVDDENNKLYSSRSVFLDKAAKFLLSAKECPYCHELNAPGQYCSYCRRDMTFTIEDRRLAKQLYIEQHPEHNNTDKYIFFIHLDNIEIRRLLDGEEIPSSKNVIKFEKGKYYEALKARRDQRKKERLERDENLKTDEIMLE